MKITGWTRVYNMQINMNRQEANEFHQFLAGASVGCLTKADIALANKMHNQFLNEFNKDQTEE